MSNKSVSEFYARLREACKRPHIGDVAVVCDVPLYPVGGWQSRVMPSTYKSRNDKEKESPDKDRPRYHIEKRPSLADSNVIEDIVVLNSVQAQANAIEAGHQFLQIPQVLVKSKTLDREFSVNEFSHRIYDADIRDTVSEDGQTPFAMTPLGKEVYSIDPVRTMKAVLRTNPLALLLGCWASTVVQLVGEKGFKWPRLVMSEIIAGLRSETLKSASKLGPMSAGRGEQAFRKKASIEWTNEDKSADADYETIKNSELNLTNIPPTLSDVGDSKAAGGVTVGWITERFQLSLQGLRAKLNTGNPAVDGDTRYMLACMAIALHGMKSDNYYLRSGCDLARQSQENLYRIEHFAETNGWAITPQDALAAYEEARKLLPVEVYDPSLRVHLFCSEPLEQLPHWSLSGRPEVNGQKKSRGKKRAG